MYKCRTPAKLSSSNRLSKINFKKKSITKVFFQPLAFKIQIQLTTHLDLKLICCFCWAQPKEQQPLLFHKQVLQKKQHPGIFQSKHVERSSSAHSYSVFVPTWKLALLQQSAREEGGHSSSQPDRRRDLKLIVSLLLQKNTPWPEECRASSETCYPVLVSLQTHLWSYTKENLQTMKAEIYSHPSQPQNWKLSSKQAWSLHLIRALFINTRQNTVRKTAQGTRAPRQQPPARARAALPPPPPSGTLRGAG